MSWRTAATSGACWSASPCTRSSIRSGSTLQPSAAPPGNSRLRPTPIVIHGLGLEALADDPTPGEAAALTDLVETLLRSFDPTRRAVIEMKLQGYTSEEIAERTGWNRVTVCASWTGPGSSSCNIVRNGARYLTRASCPRPCPILFGPSRRRGKPGRRRSRIFSPPPLWILPKFTTWPWTSSWSIWRSAARRSSLSEDGNGTPVSTPNGFPPRPTLDDYFLRFPQLKVLGPIRSTWLAVEYRVRHWFGDRPGWEAILQRYPERTEELRNYSGPWTASWPRKPHKARPDLLTGPWPLR